MRTAAKSSSKAGAVCPQRSLRMRVPSEFRWTEATGMQELLPGEQSAYVTRLSQNDDVVLGSYMDTGRGFRWTEATVGGD